MTRSIGVAFLLLAAGAEASLISGGGSSRCSNEEKHMPSMKDMARNHRTTQSSRVGGANADEIASKINAAVAEMGHPVKECLEHSLQELNEKIRDLHCHFSPFLEEALPSQHSKNDQKADGRHKRHRSLEAYEESWAAEERTVDNDPTAEEPLRHAKCAEVLMLFTHHVPAAGKESLVHEMGFVLPTMPAFDSAHAAHPDPATQETYASSYTCQTGHGIEAPTDTGSDHVLPHWRTEHHYLGRGYGAYPFWMGGAGGCQGTDCGDGGNIEVWWSESKAAEKFYHETCYMSEAGYSKESSGKQKTATNGKEEQEGGRGDALSRAASSLVGWAGRRGAQAKRNILQFGNNNKDVKEEEQQGHLRRGLLQGPPPPPPPPSDDDGAPPPPANDDDAQSTPCYNLMTGGLEGGAKAYLYTATEDFCCIATGTAEELAPPQSDFMDYMTLQGQEEITTAFYSGPSYRYVEELASSEAVSDFWYVTTLEGYPLQQGEGGTSMTQSEGKGVFIYHEYNYTTWAQNVTIDEDVFKVPDVCLTATKKCSFP